MYYSRLSFQIAPVRELIRVMGTRSLHSAHAPRGSLPEELDVSPPAPLHRPESHPDPGITLCKTLVPDSSAHVHDLACLVRQEAGDVKASSQSRSCTAPHPIQLEPGPLEASVQPSRCFRLKTGFRSAYSRPQF